MSETIGIVRGETQYGTGDLMTTTLAALLRDRGYATVNLDSVPLERPLAMLEKTGVGAVLAYNAIFVNASAISGTSVWDEAGIPYIAWLVDHPIYHLWRLARGPRLLVAACIDESHSRFLREWDLVDHTRELHHFAVGDPGDGIVERDIDVLFPASVADPARLRSQWETFPTPLGSLVEQSAAACLAQADGDLVEIIYGLCPDFGISDPELVGTAVGYAFIHADKYVRAQRRVDILDVLADAGIVVDQVGVGDGANPALRRHREHGPVPLSRLPRWLRGARLVVHAGLNRPTGSHERVFTAQHQGAVVIAEATPYWRDVLSDGSDAVLFDWTDLRRCRPA